MVRDLAPGMGQAVAERTVLRKVFDGPQWNYDTIGRDMMFNPDEPDFRLWCEVAYASGFTPIADKDVALINKPPVWRYETWEEVADRTARGNASLDHGLDYPDLREKIASGEVLMSGRHLQHGDDRQINRNGEVVINCSSAPFSWALKMLLLNGTGVGRCYDDDMMVVDWTKAPTIRCALSKHHPDYDPLVHIPSEEVEYLRNPGDIVHVVGDSREGWARCVEIAEALAYDEEYRYDTLWFVFDSVRGRNEPIMGMQGRPSSGPAPFMDALTRINSLQTSGFPLWKQAMYVDHFLAECVAVGGARRAARMATKYWKDKDILEFIKIKEGAGLWSANNSVAVDQEFWDMLAKGDLHAVGVFVHVTEQSFENGEPGFLNVDKLKQDDTELENLTEDWLSYYKYRPLETSKPMMREVLYRGRDKKYTMIVNPCGEIPLSVLGGYCVLFCIAPYHSATLEDACESARLAARAAIRVNFMKTLAGQEVARTNRIGIGITAPLEWAYKVHGATFRDLLDENHPFWTDVKTVSEAAIDEAKIYSEELGLVTPHTIMTVPPTGTISKLFALSEGWGLPAMRKYIRWVQFMEGDPMVEKYQEKGYPVKKLTGYQGNVIVGFPTETELSRIMPDEQIITASEATPEEHFKWLQLGEKYWLGEEYGGQISYTLKYDPKELTINDFRRMVVKYMPTIKACSIMPKGDVSDYEYLPEQEVTEQEWVDITSRIKDNDLVEDISIEHVDCAGGACPIDFVEVK